MNKSTRLSILAIALMMLAFQGYSQTTEWVNQVIIVNSGRFETTPPYADYVTVQSFNPTTHATNTFGTIYTQEASDILIKDNKCWIAAQDSIIEYNIDTYQRIRAIGDSGVNRLYIYNNQYLIVSKKAPVSRFYVEVLNLADLSLAGLVDGLSDQCAGLTSEYDTVYVAINGGPQGTVGKLGVIRASDFTRVRENDFGVLGAGITDLYPYAFNIFTVNYSHIGATTGTICAYNYYTSHFVMHQYGVNVRKGFGIKDDLLYLTLKGGVGSYNLTNQVIQDTVIIPDPAAAYRMSILGGAVDYVNSKLYINIGTQISNGLGYVTNLNGDSLTSFNEGINAYNVGIDFRIPSGIITNKQGSNLVVVAPNPVGTQFEVRYLGEGEAKQITVTDLTGRTLYTRNIEGSMRSWLITDAVLGSGMYILNLTSTQGIISTKFLKQ